jgi:hypothetical protein
VTAVKLEPKALLDRMRKLTAELLGYDLSNLTPAESVRLDRAATLRLELDDVQSRQLAGLPIEMAKFILASKELEAMFGGDPEAPAAGHHDFSGAREELRQLLAGRAEAIERRAQREAEATVAVAPDDSEPAVGGDAQSASVPHPLPSEAPAGGGGLPVLIDPQPAPPSPSKRLETDLERHARINAEPANPAPGPLPEWRRWVDSDGIRTSPWSGVRLDQKMRR